MNVLEVRRTEEIDRKDERIADLDVVRIKKCPRPEIRSRDPAQLNRTD